jgi:hypothetical protein
MLTSLRFTKRLRLSKPNTVMGSSGSANTCVIRDTDNNISRKVFNYINRLLASTPLSTLYSK